MRYFFYTFLDFARNHPFQIILMAMIGFISLALLGYLIHYVVAHGFGKMTERLRFLYKLSNEKPTVLFNRIYTQLKSIALRHRVPALLLALLVVLKMLLLFSLVFGKSDSPIISENLAISDSHYIFGIDISHYNGEIDWEQVSTSHHRIEFVFIRATMGTNGLDKHFARNWVYSKHHNFIRGAYHYYRPNEDWQKQFRNYTSIVKIDSGDFVPILDVEKSSRHGRKFLREGVLNWLKMAEQTYGVKPMIYTGLTFYNLHLKGYVDEYPLWIAAYSGKHKVEDVDWTFHQFTEKVRIKGVKSTVDGNNFNGDLEALRKMCK
jgi:GH25 family lysozyme M1 (1,4-beta-N-acetylmuramidase)